MSDALTLYQLVDEFLSAQQKLADLDMPANVVADTLEGLEGELTIKAEKVAFVVRNFEGAVSQIDEAIEAMIARRNALENRAKQIREYLQSNMERTGITEISCPYFKLTVQDNPESVEIHGPIISEYLRFYKAPDPQPDKTKIKEALKAGKTVIGATLKRTRRLVIK